jgi:hypothetical protein
MYTDNSNYRQLFFGRDIVRATYVKEKFFDALLTPEEKEILKNDLYLPSIQVQENWSQLLSERKLFIKKVLQRLLKIFNDKWISRCKFCDTDFNIQRRKISSITWCNVNDKWPLILQYEESVRHPKISFNV